MGKVHSPEGTKVNISEFILPELVPCGSGENLRGRGRKRGREGWRDGGKETGVCLCVCVCESKRDRNKE
jgi:hypothetical protein